MGKDGNIRFKPDEELRTFLIENQINPQGLMKLGIRYIRERNVIKPELDAMRASFETMLNDALAAHIKDSEQKTAAAIATRCAALDGSMTRLKVELENVKGQLNEVKEDNATTQKQLDREVVRLDKRVDCYRGWARVLKEAQDNGRI